MFLSGAWAGLTPVIEAWPDEVIPPEVENCGEVVWPVGVEGEAGTWTVRGTLGPTGYRMDAYEGPLRDELRAALSQCSFTLALQDDAPVEVELDFELTLPDVPLAVALTPRLKGDGFALPGFELKLGPWSATTDDAGVARFYGIPKGEHGVSATDPRYRITTGAQVDVTESPIDADVWVARDEDWELVAIYDPKTDRPGTYTVSKEEIRITPGSINDPVRAVSSRPGLVRTPFESGWLLVRGGDPGDAGLFLDGVRIPLLYHLGGFTSVVHPEMVEEVRFWPGAAPARYGRALSGTVDVVPRKLGKRQRVSAGANVAFAHAFVEIPLAKGGFAAAFRRSYLDGALTLALDAERAQIAPRFWDVQARMTGKRYSVSFLGLSDAIDAPTGADDETIEISQRAGQIQGRFDIPVGEMDLKITPWMASWRRTVDGRAAPQGTVQFFPGTRIELEGETAGARWTAGAEGEYRTYRIFQSTSERKLPAQLVDPYLDLRVGQALQLDLGLRAESLFVESQLPRVGFSPRATLRWRATDWLSLEAEAGRSHKPPDAALLIGLPDGAYLNLERSDTAGVGLQLASGPYRFTTHAWTRRMSDLSGFERDGSVGGQFGRADGIENQLLAEWSNLSIRAIYQYTRSTRWEDPGAQLERNPTPWDQPHNFQLIVLGQLPRDWAVAGRARVSSGFPSPREDTTAFDLLTQQPTELTADGGRLKPFSSLDLKVSHRFLLRTWQLDAFLDLQNLTNSRVHEPIITGFDDSDPAYSKGLPILPVFGFEGVFWPGGRE